MGGLSRYVSVLRLFEEARDDWSVAEMAAALGLPVSTVYRTVREMLAADFLEAGTAGRYRLGACFIEFDRLARITDPLYRSGTTLLRDVVIQARVPCVALLSRLYDDKVMCIADYTSAEDGVQTSYERGRPRPLTRGATAKVILAQLPPRRLNKLLDNAAADAAPIPKNVRKFREELAAIRKRGFSVTRGEVDKKVVGIAAPVTVMDRALIGSLSLVVPAARLDETLERRLVLLVVSSAKFLASELAVQTVPARAAARR
ncbi:MAG TPA: IclR family transcriptional regulator C-terminal domain-containing protein [Steroidobacteraceae bacterium]|nr:IclR family transcriptional regulator C-terminal domain-containing protein [Steroidobacteraceae bacterium]